MTTIEVLTPWVQKVVQEVLELDHLHRDDDGDITIPLERTVMYVRFGNSPHDIPTVRLFGPLLKEVEPSQGLYEKLNEVNRDSSYLRFYFIDGVIWVSMEFVAESFRHEDLANGLGAAGFYSMQLGALLGILDAKPWREPQATDPGTNESAGNASNGSGSFEEELAASPGPVAHVTVPSKVLPDDPSPADGAMNLRMGYL